MSIITGTTASGIDFEIDEAKLDNFELLEALHALNKGDGLAIVDVNELLLGGELTKKIKEHIKKRDGECSVTAFAAELTDILTSMGNRAKK